MHARTTERATIIVSRDQSLIDALERKLPAELKAYLGLLRAKEHFPDVPLLQIGGSVRDEVLRRLYGWDLPLKDLDILVDDTALAPGMLDLRERCRGLPGAVKPNGFGHPKWTVTVDGKGFDIDLSAITGKVDRDEKGTLGGYFRSGDINIGGFAYSPKQGAVYALPEALDGLVSKTITILKPENVDHRPEATIPRMLGYEVRFPGFRLDGKAEEYVWSRMNAELWQRIVGYAINYKKMGEKEPETLAHIERRVREITRDDAYRFAA